MANETSHSNNMSLNYRHVHIMNQETVSGNMTP